MASRRSALALPFTICVMASLTAPSCPGGPGREHSVFILSSRGDGIQLFRDMADVRRSESI